MNSIIVNKRNLYVSSHAARADILRRQCLSQSHYNGEGLFVYEGEGRGKKCLPPER